MRPGDGACAKLRLDSSRGARIASPSPRPAVRVRIASRISRTTDINGGINCMTTRRITKQPAAKSNKPQTNRAFERHQRKCVICHHPDREAIEEEFVHWNTVWRISKQYGIGDYRSIYRHAHATHLTERRRENLRSALDHIVESARETTATGDCILRAIRAYSCVDSLGRWVDPPSQVNFSTVPAAQPATQPSPIIDVVEPEPLPELDSSTELDPESSASQRDPRRRFRTRLSRWPRRGSDLP
jgi:hypothetical protein